MKNIIYYIQLTNKNKEKCKTFMKNLKININLSQSKYVLILNNHNKLTVINKIMKPSSKLKY